MLYSRSYKPKKNDLIYHYCSAETFHSICTNKNIRLCDVFSMNDFMEMHWGYSIWEKVANNLITEFGYEFIDSIDKIIHISGSKCLVLASCFSLDGDVLSQWRAYSNDGNGYCIGFNSKDLLKLNIKALKVEYNEQKQIKELTSVIKALYSVEQNLREEEQFGEDFFNACSNIAFDLVAFKNPAFSEEKEIKTNPIKKVIIGPKNLVLSSAISVYLETLNLGDIEIERSKSSYR
ncbi:DUF2971 domain-containing protein [Epilithonimonas zeae]|uniref:DUF2971 domain-containing protein n=1 Tax=Epilithonimonas zeae TaxID=1416779 RepID=UPI00200F1642|nr:DUF2971 domain-containing protein [Epilithonimonas zeae]UQB69607.1 DUF2971 domain-containing protein [Epilithonimonas zeae]